MKDREGWLQRLMEDVEEPVTRLPLVEICGEGRVLIEHHWGVSCYKSDRIDVRVAYGVVAVEGSRLRLARMTRAQLVICGRIDAVRLVRRAEK